MDRRRTQSQHCTSSAASELYKRQLCRMRIERDVLAHCLDVSYCSMYGCASFESASSFDGFYFGSARDVESAVLQAKEEHGRGVFIVVDPGRALFASCRLQFVLPSDAILPGTAVKSSHRLVGVLADFGIFRWKAKRRRERVLEVAVQAELSSRRLLGVQPVLVTRVSPIAHLRFPKPKHDSAPYGDCLLYPSDAADDTQF